MAKRVKTPKHKKNNSITQVKAGGAPGTNQTSPEPLLRFSNTKGIHTMHVYCTKSVHTYLESFSPVFLDGAVLGLAEVDGG